MSIKGFCSEHKGEFLLITLSAINDTVNFGLKAAWGSLIFMYLAHLTNFHL